MHGVSQIFGAYGSRSNGRPLTEWLMRPVIVAEEAG
jgi:hypothetical protein